MINPYSSVNWGTVNRVMSCSHEHCETQAQFETLLGGGIEHIAISNYYPSEPVYPLSDKFENIPSGIIASRNAEHHQISISNLHLNGLGSRFTSGKERGETPIGCNNADWRFVIGQILANLQYADSGGVTINHPNWSHLTFNQVIKMLDYDDRVLGIEFYNQTSEADTETGWALELWDDILETGRRCWGFAVADHGGQANSNWIGRNILLVSTKDDHNCLRAYRNGCFYGQLHNTNLAFTDISYSNGTVSASAQNATSIDIIVDGVKTTTSGTSATKSGISGAKYCRVEAHSADDSIYSNPIMINPKSFKKKNNTTNILLGIV